jgi:hypothetical protein
MLTRSACSHWQWATVTVNINPSSCSFINSSAFSTRSDTGFSVQPSQKFVKTIKSVQDLPRALIKDGSPIAPLPEFKGGLELNSSLKRCKKLSRVKKVDDEQLALGTRERNPARVCSRRNQRVTSSKVGIKDGRFTSSLFLNYS